MQIIDKVIKLIDKIIKLIDTTRKLVITLNANPVGAIALTLLCISLAYLRHVW